MLAFRLEGHACVRCYLSVLSCKLASPTTETDLLSIKQDQRVFGLKKKVCNDDMVNMHTNPLAITTATKFSESNLVTLRSQNSRISISHLTHSTILVMVPKQGTAQPH